MQIERVPISDLTTDPNNVRLHAAESIDGIASSLRKWGQQKPIVVDGTGRIVSGNGTLEAARKMGWTEIDVVRTSLQGHEAVAFAIADNRTAELSEWDWGALQEAIVDLQEREIDPEDLGFDADAMRMVAKRMRSVEVPGMNEPDPAGLPEEPTAKLGDIWILDRHRIFCGDARMATSYKTVLDGLQANMVWTDPPYGVDYVGKTADALTIAGDSVLPHALHSLLVDTFSIAITYTEPGACWYVTAPSGPQFLAFAKVLNELGVWRQTLAWVKDSLVMGHSDFHYRHEAIMYGWTPGGPHIAPPDRKQDSVWEIARPARSTEHPTMKPIELVARGLTLSGNEEDAVLDPFLGSGTTILACEQLNRSCYGIELDPRYVDVAVQRWVALTGGTPECVPAGVPVVPTAPSPATPVPTPSLAPEIPST